jgi:hypothetical protein
LAYQRLNIASDITNWPNVANPFNHHIMNPLRLKYLWPETGLQPISGRQSKNKKLLHILPGQKAYFQPSGWTVKVWKYYDDIYDYCRYGYHVPFYLWVLFHYGGLLFPQELSPWLEKHWSETKVVLEADRLSAPAGSSEVEAKIKEMVYSFDPEFEGGRWGELKEA